MKTKSLVLLAMALGCGLVAMLGVQQIMSSEKAPPKDTVKVLVARQEIDSGERLDDSLVAFEELPREAVPSGAVTDASQFEERALKSRAYPGDIILQAKLGERGQFGAANSIPEGMRVVTVPVTMTTVHSGMIRPGDRIDVVVTYTVRKPGTADTSRTLTVLEYIEVFAIDRIREGEGGGDSTKGAKAENLSVLVTPDQANLLMLANSKGKLQLSLRNGADTEQAKVAAIDDKVLEDLKSSTGIAEAPEEPAPKTVAKRSDKNFKEFLESDGDVEPPPVELPEDVWAIEIFEGDTRRVELIRKGEGTVPARLPATGSAPTPAAAPSATPAPPSEPKSAAVSPPLQAV